MNSRLIFGPHPTPLLYSANQNNGQITQSVETVSGQTISYKYDALKRLISSAAMPNNGKTPSAWNESFQYDGFGNLTAKVLNGTTSAIPADTVTNRLLNAIYDKNGNMTSGFGGTFDYDVANRMITAKETSGGTESYSYTPENKRILRVKSSGSTEWTLWGARGEKLGTFAINAVTYGNNYFSYYYTVVNPTFSFAGRMIWEGGSPVVSDRLGTNRANGATFYPYGEEITSTTNDRTKFGTYMRDGFTGLDYADQRYYASTYGRFTIPDPGASKAAKPDHPTSWNAYAYVKGDPVNLNDPAGLYDSSGNPDYCDVNWDDPFCQGVSPLPPNPGGGGPPPPPPPQCSISLYERPVNVKLPVLGNVTVGEHLYIYASIQYEDGSGISNTFLCQGGPSDGKLVGGCADATNAPTIVGTSGPGLPGNVQVGGSYTAANACEDLTKLIVSVDLYQINGNFAPYRPVIGQRSAYGYNSKSCAFTLLNDIGLAGYYPNKNPYSWFGTPANTPGWGRLVPGL